MKRIILSLIKMSSLVIIVLSFLLFLMTFSNQSYFIGLGEDYLKGKLSNKIELLDSKVDSVISTNTKAGKLLDKYNFSDKVKKFKENIKSKSLIKTDEIISKAFNGGLDNIKDIKILGKSLKQEIKSIVNNFILDIRIFLITNIVGFGIIYLLMFYRSRADIIRNMFFIVTSIFIIMIISLLYYIVGQNWIINIVTNNFMGYSYPLFIIILIIFFIYFLKKDISTNDKKYIEEAKSGRFYWSIKDLKESKNVKSTKTVFLFIFILIDILLGILFIPFNI